MMENKYDTIERFGRNKKLRGSQIKYLGGDYIDDTINIQINTPPSQFPTQQHINDTQNNNNNNNQFHHSIHNRKNETISISDSIHFTNTDTLAKINLEDTDNQNQIITRQALAKLKNNNNFNHYNNIDVSSHSTEKKEVQLIQQKSKKSQRDQENNLNLQQQKEDNHHQIDQEIQFVATNNENQNHHENNDENNKKIKQKDFYDNDDNDNDNDNDDDDDDDDDDNDKNDKNNENNNKDDDDNRIKKIETQSTRRSLHNSSSLQLEDYFNQDVDTKKKAQMDKIVNDITRFKSYFVKFRMSLFFEFFFYHALFVIFLGPLANPIIYKFGKGLPRNLFFWGFNYGFLYQTIYYILSVSAIVLYCYYRTQHIYFQSEFIYLFLGMIYRIYTIATKYATFDPFKIEALKQNTFKPEELRSDFFLLDWREQKDRIIYEEIYFAQRVYDIDPSWFYLEFIVDPEQETKDRFKQHNQTLSQYHKIKKIPFQPQPINITNKDADTFYIYGIIKEIIDAFQNKYKFQIEHAKTISYVYSFLRAIIPTIYKLANEDINYIEDSKWYEWIISFNIAFLTQKLYFFTCWTIFQGVIDMKRKIYMMEQMAFMISPRKLRSLDTDKLFPTINIFKSSNLKAWQLMRHVCQEYGKRYDIRVQSNFSGMILVIVVAIVVLSLNYADMIALEIPFTIIIIIETFCILLVFVQILYYGAKINECFDLHDTILNYNKTILIDIYRMRRRYFCQQFKTTNYLYSKAIQKIRDEVQMLKLPSPCEYLDEIVCSYDTHIEELKFDQRQNPFKIGSIKITNGLLESGIVGVISVFVAIGGKFLSNRLEE